MNVCKLKKCTWVSWNISRISQIEQIFTLLKKEIRYADFKTKKNWKEYDTCLKIANGFSAIYAVQI